MPLDHRPLFANIAVCCERGGCLLSWHALATEDIKAQALALLVLVLGP